ncbi:hypothetical protein D3C80_1841180 [compost metagenome]
MKKTNNIYHLYCIDTNNRDEIFLSKMKVLSEVYLFYGQWLFYDKLLNAIVIVEDKWCLSGFFGGSGYAHYRQVHCISLLGCSCVM